ncbi:hypothetical protein CVT25_011869 [Psilocybe cyanescens]|uniref:F-box domain-containing protein n=1 Tax=Psilocybe cyanescens TaxID=93625 RepID=A0A409WIW9_PSICY|nr:hypothetical protein CVT25_011869 [Psilocybe cyanescens]
MNARSKLSFSNPLTLGAVCLPWRQLAWSTPQLWSHIACDLDNKPLSNKTEVIREWLSRSGQLPLSIRISFDPRARYDWIEVPQSFIHFINVFNDYSNRWQKLIINGPPGIICHFTGNSSGAPILRILGIHITPSHQPSTALSVKIPDQFSMRGIKPRPNYISITRMSLKLLDISWDNLTWTNLEYSMTGKALELLQLAPRLEKCRIHLLPKNPRDNSPMENLRVVHRNLRALIIVGVGNMNDTHTMPFLDQLTLPALQDLSVTATSVQARDVAAHSLASLVARSTCILKSLTFYGPGFDYNNIITIFTEISSIERLALFPLCANEEDMADILVIFALTNVASDGRSQLTFLPNLQRFVFGIHSPESIPWLLIPNILGTFAGPSRPLTTLTIIEKPSYSKGSRNINPPKTLIQSGKIDRDTIEDLLEMVEAGVTLYLPFRIPKTYLMTLLE